MTVIPTQNRVNSWNRIGPGPIGPGLIEKLKPAAISSCWALVSTCLSWRGSSRGASILLAGIDSVISYSRFKPNWADYGDGGGHRGIL